MLNEIALKQIFDGLTKKEGENSKADLLFGRDGDCPICFKKAEPKEPLYFVDREHLQFETQCCETRGGIVSFVILTGKIERGENEVERALIWLLDFVR